MDEREARDFMAHGTRTGKLAVVRRDGGPMVVPVWFVFDGEDLVFTTGAETVKGRAMRHEPRVSVCVDDEAPPYAFARLDGVARLDAAPGPMLAAATRIAARYMGPARAEEYGRRNAVPGELLARVRPTRIVGKAGVAD